MSPTMLRLAADLLDKAARTFASHGCNDFETPDYLTVDDLKGIADWLNRAVGADEDDAESAEHLKGGWLSDWLMMRMLAARLRGPGEAG